MVSGNRVVIQQHNKVQLGRQSRRPGEPLWACQASAWLSNRRRRPSDLSNWRHRAGRTTRLCQNDLVPWWDGVSPVFLDTTIGRDARPTAQGDADAIIKTIVANTA